MFSNFTDNFLSIPDIDSFSSKYFNYRDEIRCNYFATKIMIIIFRNWDWCWLVLFNQGLLVYQPQLKRKTIMEPHLHRHKEI